MEKEERIKRAQEELRVNWEKMERNDPLGFEMEEKCQRLVDLQKKKRKEET